MEHAFSGSCDSPNLLQYQYEPMLAGDGVRILNLEPASDFQSPLRGFISQAKGNEYSAVSYTWGGQTTSHQLLLEMSTHWTSLPITQNADLLLRYLRDYQTIIRLWIDGVCLNQQDQREKDQQIPLMGQIYARAKSVHIWLGDDAVEEAQHAFSLIRTFQTEGARMLYPGTVDFICLEKFFNRSWFTRRWVIQEIFFARKAYFHCGNHTLSLSRVMAALTKAPGIGWSELPGWGSQMLKSSIMIGQVHRQRLLSLLWDLHESECSDKRDRIAAVYSLSDTYGRPPLHYNIGNWKQMYKEISSYYLKDNPETAHAILLHLCDFGSIESSMDNKVPSWVPNWSTRREELVSFQVLDSFVGYEWTAMELKLSRHTLRICFDFLTFICGCGIVDQVVCPSLSAEFWEDIIGLVRWQEKRLDIVKDCFKVGSVVYQERRRHQMEVDSLSSLLVSILAGKFPTPAHAWPNLRKSIRRLFADLSLGRNQGKNLQALTSSQTVLLQRIRSAIGNRAILRIQATIGYYWAIGPLTLIKGDWLIPIIAQGDKVPHRPEPRVTRFMSLRPTGPEKERDAWYPAPASIPEDRLRRLVWPNMAKIDSVHITAKFSGSAGSCLHLFDYDISRGGVMWWVRRRATQAAERRHLPGPIVFDIV